MGEGLTWEMEARLRLNAVSFLAPSPKRRLLEILGESLWKASQSQWASIGGFGLETAAMVRASALSFDARKEWDRAQSLGVRIVNDQDPLYPALLKSVPEAPLVLYVKGRIFADAPCVAFVGSRHPTSYGRRMAKTLAGEAAASGLVVVSGLARGLDTEAHKAAIESGGSTWAVLGSGLARVYPPENESLAREITAAGALISEFPLEAPPLPGHFPLRNRIISGLSWATVVVEGRFGSGSLITAHRALEQGRAVLAVPGPADGPLSEAPHGLIRQGARLMTSLNDLLEELPPSCLPLIRGGCVVPVPSESAAVCTSEESLILELLGEEGLTLEELNRASTIDFPRLSTIIFALELKNLIVSVPGQRYAKQAKKTIQLQA